MGVAAVWAIVGTVSQASDDDLPSFAFAIAALGLVGVFCAWLGATFRQNA